ncbi:hypothetical protein [Vibrio mimicus]|uniref:Uncharacterized protein n=1 Tax=Vibrio mimicus TaxID=674 RepID=A0A2J9VJD6_VIBMI|nr:hypothetical protein [Vibrio mimicus]EEW09198.1 hypothetical protein VMD_33030 [Vibrio mimicus VM573]PNM63888.1 hypothetical protein AL544_002800 [Vibrio mimicus]
MKFQKVESRLAWFNEISAGIGLVVGYLCYTLFWLLSPETKIEVQVTEPVYEDIVLGYIPSEIETDNIPTGEQLAKKKKDAELKPITAQVPKFTNEGQPVLKTTSKTFKGMGTPSVIVNRVELLKPNFGSYSYTVTQRNKKFLTYFSPDIFYTGTGFYYEQKSVEFSGGKNAELFAVKVATAFAFLSFVLFLLKIRPNPRKCLERFKKARFDMGEDESST